MIVPFLDLAAAHAELRGEIDRAIASVIDRGQFILGPELAAFESEFAAYTQTANCVGVGNGLDALEISLRALGIQAGDEVLVPSNTFIATWLGVSRAGGRPIPVEPNEFTYNLDPDRVEAAIGPHTRAIVAVHLYGQPADMSALRDIADRNALWLVEDAAQAHGARAGDLPVGGLSDAAAWSFYPSKNLGALGDGGAITTHDKVVADRARLLRNYGERAKYRHEIVGVNSRLDEIQAAVLRAKLRVLDEWNARRSRVAARYCDDLRDGALTLPQIPDWATPVWHLFVVRTRWRDQLQEHLAAAGIGTLIHYPLPPHLEAPYAVSGSGAGSLPIAEALAREVLSLPIGPQMTDTQTAQVIDAIHRFGT